MRSSDTNNIIAAHETHRMRHLFGKSLCPIEVTATTDHGLMSVTHFDTVHLHDVEVIHDHGFGFRLGNRTAQLVREMPCDDFLITLPLDSQMDLRQSGVRSQFSKGNFSFLSTARPFTASMGAECATKPFSHTTLRVPGRLLRQRIPNIDQVCSQSLELLPGIGNVMVALTEIALKEGRGLSSQQAIRFRDHLLDTISETTLHAPQAKLLLSQTKESAKALLLEQAIFYIFSNLSDPDLSTGKIADYCQVSERYIRAAFETTPYTVRTFIRESRLMECRKALQSEACQNSSITDVAMRWGFNDSAYFSRAYRSRFGVSPSSDRHK